jgi:hypothetical protein
MLGKTSPPYTAGTPEVSRCKDDKKKIVLNYETRSMALNEEVRDDQLTKATVTSQKGTLCRIYSKKPLKITSGGKSVATKREGNLILFPTRPKARYVVLPGD